MKILHLATDDKFISHGLHIFQEAITASHEVIVCAYPPLKYVKIEASVATPFQILRGLKEIDLPSYDLIVLHSLNQNWFPLVNKVPSNIPIVWLGWGLDYYDVLYKEESVLYKNLTLKCWQERRLSQSNYLDVKNIISRVIKKFFYPSKINIIKRIDVFSPVLPSEYRLVKESCDHLTAAYSSWNYGNIEENLIKGFENEVVKGSAILVGNSAGFTNNHLDSFDLLGQIGVTNRKVICPLSYGDSDYASHIMSLGKEQFGDSFFPLINFMSMKEYVSVLCDCGYVIMDHLRQQAVGNIVIMLFLGAKVFLNEACPTFGFLKELGVNLYSIQELSGNPKLLDSPLSDGDRSINKEAVLGYWGKEEINRKTKSLVNAAIKSKAGKEIELS